MLPVQRHRGRSHASLRLSPPRVAVEQPTTIVTLRAALDADRRRLVERWLDAATRRCWQLRARSARRAELEPRCEALLEAWAEGLRGEASLASGTTALREPIQRLAFLAGWTAGQDWPIGVVLALAQALRELLRLPDALADDLALVVTEAYTSALRDQAAARQRELLTKSQVVCLLRPSVVALWLVADPDDFALDDALGRWLLLAVINDARHLLLEVSALAAPAPVLVRVARRLVAHADPLRGRQLWLVAPEAEGLALGLSEASGLPVAPAASVVCALEAAAATLAAAPEPACSARFSPGEQA